MIVPQVSLATSTTALAMSGGYFVDNTTVHRFGEPASFLNPWTCVVIAKKTFATQLVDFAMIFRSMLSDTSRLTMAVRQATGYVNVRMKNADGSLGREIETTVAPALNSIAFMAISWDGTELRMATNFSNPVSSSTHIALVPFAGETAGIYIGNRGDGTTPYRGRVLGGCFYAGSSTLAQLQEIVRLGVLPSSDYFTYAPSIYGDPETLFVDEPHSRQMTIDLVTETQRQWWFGS